MTHVTLRPGDPDREPGTWESARPLAIAVISCPECGRTSTLGRRGGGSRHTVEADGTVSPSVVCPHPPCTWHVWAQLEGWPGA